MKWAGLTARPALAWEAILTAWAFRARGGLLPSRPLLRWRSATAYGRAGQRVELEDVVRYLRWRRTFRFDRRRRA